MAIMGWCRPFTKSNVLFLCLKNTGKKCKHRKNAGKTQGISL